MDEQDVCPGYDDNSEAPIGYSVKKSISVNMGVIHQWIIFFQKGGRSGIEDHAEMRINKYAWQRDFVHSRCNSDGVTTQPERGGPAGPALVIAVTGVRCWS